MKLSTRFRYGTRFLVDLGAHGLKKPIRLKEIVERQKISKRYLEQIIITLKAAGIIRTVKGAKGGYYLTDDPESLRLMDIYNILEGSTSPVDCLEDPKACPFDMVETCSTIDTWRKLKTAIEGVIKDVTLADLIRDWRKKISIR